MVRFGERIKERRWQLGLTQKDLAVRLGVTGSAISSYENNTRLPSFDILIKMSRVFHMSTDMLLGCASTESGIKIDISELNELQKKIIIHIIETYKNFNEIERKSH